MKIIGTFQKDVVGEGTPTNLNGGWGQGRTPLQAGHVRVNGPLAGGGLAFYVKNPLQEWMGVLCPAAPSAATRAAAEAAREERVRSIMDRDKELREMSPLEAGTAVHFAKGTARSRAPEGAIAYLGGGESSHIVWLGVNTEGEWFPLGGDKARSSGPNTWAEPLPEGEVRRIFEQGSLLNVRRSPDRVFEVMFGVRG